MWYDFETWGQTLRYSSTQAILNDQSSLRYFHDLSSACYRKTINIQQSQVCRVNRPLNPGFVSSWDHKDTHFPLVFVPRLD